MSLISCNNVSLSYENKIVLEDVSFDIDEGDYLCIVGQNGSGKSTIVKALCGLKNPISGEIRKYHAQGDIGYLPQQNDTQKDFPASVWEVVISGCLNRHKSPFYTKEDKKTTTDNMIKLGITNLKNTSFRELSGGQRQRVLLARTLCAAKSLIILDEPTAGLDPIVCEEFYSLIKKIHNDGMAVVMVSHDIKSAVRYSTKILHLHTGVEYFGKTEDYIKSDAAKGFLN